MDAPPTTRHSRGVSETAAARDAATAADVAVTDTASTVESAVPPSVVAPDRQPEPAAPVTLAAPAAGVADFSVDAEAELCAQVLGDRRHGL